MAHSFRHLICNCCATRSDYTEWHNIYFHIVDFPLANVRSQNDKFFKLVICLSHQNNGIEQKARSSVSSSSCLSCMDEQRQPQWHGVDSLTTMTITATAAIIIIIEYNFKYHCIYTNSYYYIIFARIVGADAHFGSFRLLGNRYDRSSIHVDVHRGMVLRCDSQE